MGGSNVLRKIYKKYKRTRNYYSLSKNHLLLASFPKSGSTWVRFILANVIVSHLDLEVKVDFCSVHRLFPDMHKEKIWECSRFHPFPKMVKTHARITLDDPKTIYLVRKPEKVFKSYYKYLKKESKSNLSSFSQLLDDDQKGLESWMRHVSHYLNRADLVLRYEDLLENPLKTVQGIKKLLETDFGIHTSTDIWNTALSLSSRENMAKLEKGQGRPYGSDNYAFVGGSEGRNVVEFKKYRPFILEKTDSIRRELGYETGK